MRRTRWSGLFGRGLDRVPLENMVTWLGLCGIVVFAGHACGGGFSADGSQVGHVPDRLRFDVRGPLEPPGLVRPVPVVVD
jgi:hypothetical protein